MADAPDSLAGLPMAIRVQPPEANGNEDGCPFLLHFPTGFVPGDGVVWKVREGSLEAPDAQPLSLLAQREGL